MSEQPVLTALGLMSGTSVDGIDAAILRTDGDRVEALGPSASFPYDETFRARLRGMFGRPPQDADGPLIRELTLKHAEAIRGLLARNRLSPGEIDVIGFHGQTVLHDASAGLTCQIGDGGLLAAETGIQVVSDFRSRDMAEGGEGAPFAPLYHAALARDMDRPLAVLNVGGVANVTWIGDGGNILAFDTGPGNALIDDWTAAAISRPMDEGGRLARGGRVDDGRLKTLLDDKFFLKQPPKSLDRNDFSLEAVQGLSAADGAATLTAFTAAAVARARDYFPAPPKRWLVSGGGRHNRTLMAVLTDLLNAPVATVETAGWQGDMLEAQAFGYLAVRSLYGLPLSLPGTTGVRAPMCGGALHSPVAPVAAAP